MIAVSCARWRRASSKSTAAALTSWPGDYENYLRRREERLHAEAQANALFDKKLAQEEVWIRQGIKARRTRNEGRVRRLEAMRRERSAATQPGRQCAHAGRYRRRTRGARSSRRRTSAIAYPGRSLIAGFSTMVMRGDRIGLIGPNGSGKTTLLRLLLGQLEPQAGEVRLGTQLEIAYFDQHRAQLREDMSALDNVADGREFIEINGARKHAIGYLQDFLFTPERARAPIIGAVRRRAQPACCWRACSPSPRTCWSWTSRPTISTWKRSNCSRNCWSTIPAPCCWSRTIANSSTTWSPARSPSKARAGSASMSVVMRNGCASVRRRCRCGRATTPTQPGPRRSRRCRRSAS